MEIRLRMGNKAIVLLHDSDNLKRRLLAVSQEPDLQEHLYPTLIKHGGSKALAIVVLRIIDIAFDQLEQAVGKERAGIYRTELQEEIAQAIIKGWQE